MRGVTKTPVRRSPPNTRQRAASIADGEEQLLTGTQTSNADRNDMGATATGWYETGAIPKTSRDRFQGSTELPLLSNSPPSSKECQNQDVKEISGTQGQQGATGFSVRSRRDLHERSSMVSDGIEKTGVFVDEHLLSRMIEMRINEMVNTCQQIPTDASMQRYSNCIDVLNSIPNFETEGGIHPVDFVEQVEQIMRESNVSFNSVKVVLQKKFRGSSNYWARAFLPSFNDFYSFKKEFIKHFWGPNQQIHVKIKLEAGRYEQGPYVDHFTEYYALSRHIQPPISEEVVVSLIARHFPPQIAVLLLSVSRATDALAVLQQADYYSKAEKRKSSVLENPVQSRGYSPRYHSRSNGTIKSVSTISVDGASGTNVEDHVRDDEGNEVKHTH